MPPVRAKMKITSITQLSTHGTNGVTHEVWKFQAVAKTAEYPKDGSDEDNTYAKFSPQGELSLTVANPALLGKFMPG